MGNACMNLRRNKKRLQEEELNFRRRMEERIQQSSKRLKAIPAEQLNQVINGNDLINMRPKTHKLDQNKPTCTPLRLNSDGQFVKIDEKFIETYFNNLNNLDKQKLINNLNNSQNLSTYEINRSLNNQWQDQILNQQNNIYNLSRINQLHFLQSNNSLKLNSFDNQSFVNTSIDSNLFDQNLLKNNFISNQFNNQQLINLNNQLSLSTNSTNLINNNNRLNYNHYNDGLIINSNIDLNNKNYGSQLNQSISNNILDFAADRIFSELEYMDNRFNGNSIYLPLDGLTKLNRNSKTFNHHFSTNLNQQQIPIQLNNLSNLNLNKPIHQFNHFNQNNNLTTLNQTNPNLINSKLTYSTYVDTIDSSLNNYNKNLRHNRTSLDLLPAINNLVPKNSIESSVNKNTSIIKEENDDHVCNNNDINYNEDDLEAKNYLTINSTRNLIEEEKDELNDSGNGSGGCEEKKISRAESIENNLVNNQIEMEPWFFTQINTRNAAEHVLRMKGNRVGTFLVRRAQKIKYTADAPYVLSLKVNETAQTSFDKQNHNLHSNSNLNYFNEQQIKTTKDILHYKIYSHSVCLNCNLIMFYINPSNQFPTIRQLISFYSETDNCGLPIKLSKPCLPFDLLNCCYSANASTLSSTPTINKINKINCEICNELISSSRTNRWSTGNLSNIGTQPSQSTSLSSNEFFQQNYIEQNPDTVVKLVKDDHLNNSNAKLLSKSLNSIKGNCADRMSNSNGGMPVNSANRILKDIKFEDQLNKLNNQQKNRFSTSLDDVGLNNSGNSSACASRLSLKDRYKNRSLASINYLNDHHLTSSGSSLSRKSSDSRKIIRTGSIKGSLIGGHKYRVSSSSSFKENIYTSNENLKRRSSSIRLKPDKCKLKKAISCSINNVSLVKNLSANS